MIAVRFYGVYPVQAKTNCSFYFSLSFDAIEYQPAIDFSDNEIIPTLTSEKQDLFVKYGRQSTFENLLYAESGFLENINVDSNDLYVTEPEYVVLNF
ncbi:hypothetical protein [Parasediminibacterium sp. JCM 36343]|uniref:hypothetical protein n=1 Tax=Parasediminibacterium sp. JCM 36343 TaxID=3374279 RepID=UPI00397D7709